jgi:superfamily I DNA and/or RNA helicase
MQVNPLKQCLPTGTKIGTVDKFQGQQAAVAILSMTTSRGEDAPRGTEFLFNRNRFNVAISRAHAARTADFGVASSVPKWRAIQNKITNSYAIEIPA